VFHWPIELTAFSLGSAGVSRAATLEVTPRGAAFTLAALSHVGHPAHLAVIDAYLKGQVRLTPTATIGDDSRTVAASLATPLIAAHELGVERLSLVDLVLLPRDLAAATGSDRAAEGQPARTPDSVRLLLRAHDIWHWVRGAERFEAPGCLGTRAVGQASQWHQVNAELPERGAFVSSARAEPATIRGEMRAASSPVSPVPKPLLEVLRELALTHAARLNFDRYFHTFRLIEKCDPSILDGLPLNLADLRAEGPIHSKPDNVGPFIESVDEPTAVVSVVGTAIREHYHIYTFLDWGGLAIDVSLVADLDGYWTLCLLPPADADAANLFDPMRDLTWEVIDGLIGRPLPDRRTEPIALRLVGKDGRTTTLDVGASVVIGRNQTVFACWVGSDGRVILKLFPPGGMVGR
jgi:hypothetical protein